MLRKETAAFSMSLSLLGYLLQPLEYSDSFNDHIQPEGQREGGGERMGGKGGGIH